MKKNDLFLLMSEVDPQYVSEAENAMQRSAKKSEKRLWTAWQKGGVLAAACLILLLCAVPVVKRLMNGVTPGVIPPDTAPGTVVVENPDFVIENGVLLSYVGNDHNVVLPDEVVEISRDAFAEKGDIIDTITIGKNVEVIDHLFLSHVDHLSGVVVEEENERFEIYEGVFVDKENTYLIDVGGRFQQDFKRFLEIGEEMGKGKLYFGEEVKFVLNCIAITVSATHLEPDEYCLTEIKTIEYQGNVVELAPEEYHLLHGNTTLTFYLGDDFLFYASSFSPVYYFITPNWFYRYKGMSYSDRLNNPNASTYYYEPAEDGLVRYQRILAKFDYRIDFNDIVGGLMHTTSLDEFCKEEGYITIQNGIITHHPTASYTFAEAVDIYNLYLEAFNYQKENGDSRLKSFDTMNDLLEFNRDLL